MAGAPKFPSSLPLRLLLRLYYRSGDSINLNMAHDTLKAMAAGGIYDQIGGGFHRYAIDEHWLIPHFEKMLYDNALLGITYLEGYQATGDTDLSEVAREILAYLNREMKSPGGGFYSATDADSIAPCGAREEGAYFTWTLGELEAVLGKERGRAVGIFYGVTEIGNFEGRSVLHRPKGLKEVADVLKVPIQTLREDIEQSRPLLYGERLFRPSPFRDEKILASWNGLAISFFARAGLVLNDPNAVAVAIGCADFIAREMIKAEKLAHSYQESEAKGEAFLDDYAFIISGLLDLYETTGYLKWLNLSRQLCLVVEENFVDEELGGYFLTGRHHEELLAREKPSYDGAVPSGNSVMAMNLLRLHAFTQEPTFLAAATRVLTAFGARLVSAPTALPEMLLALDFFLGEVCQVVIVAPKGHREAALPFLDQLRPVFLPNRALVVACEGDPGPWPGLLPLLEEKCARGGEAVAYVCVGQTCREPTTDPEEFLRILAK